MLFKKIHSLKIIKINCLNIIRRISKNLNKIKRRHCILINIKNCLLMGNCHQNSIIPSICQHDQIKHEYYSQFTSYRKQISLVINKSKGSTQSLIEELSQKMIQYQQITHYYISFESEDFIYHLENLNNAFNQSNQIIELSLNFQRLSIKNNGLQKIGQCLSHCQKVKRLELCLGSNQFTYQGIQLLCNNITKLKLLERIFLELYINQLESDSVVDIGDAVAELPCLFSLKLDFSFNNVQFDGIQKFVNSINKSDKLQYLDLTLDVNNILDIGSLAFKQIEQKTQLTQLSLSLCSNNITNVDQLIDSISQLFNLYNLVIDLSYNPVSSSVDQLEIVKKLNNLKKLLIFKFKMRITANHRFAKKYIQSNFKKLVIMQFNS
ncbi:kinase domain protein, putative (macronuclear) [Tetrahymena thermophila SB210]|uniref:Kinase domain protein, putative n=1 Tax=Tetrahymena thermophila (strain SB210) TaxID=312017 RepID=W7XGY7_TETTS|nr:kinase domain protein, putative [Tetrahymena thermophila SB210]EWS73546.1 kinase domain protein, putative [Tetrahymena thermophila SB210]|eukprot:XP_012653936.1 kinase domain protein, putative [Tetrahymena thermophila SB210]